MILSGHTDVVPVSPAGWQRDPFAAELAFCFRLAKHLKAQREQVRGRPETFTRPDYGFRLDTVNFYFHDALLRDNPATYRRGAPHWNPYEMQYHLFSKNQPENLVFLERMRALLDEYEPGANTADISKLFAQLRDELTPTARNDFYHALKRVPLERAHEVRFGRLSVSIDDPRGRPS